MECEKRRNREAQKLLPDTQDSSALSKHLLQPSKRDDLRPTIRPRGKSYDGSDERSLLGTKFCSKQKAAQERDISCTEPLLKSSLKERYRRASADDKPVLPKCLRRAFSIQHERVDGKPQPPTIIKSDYSPELQSDHNARSTRRKSKTSSPRASSVHFGDARFLHPISSGGQSFFQQRASFQSESRAFVKCDDNPCKLRKQDAGIVCSNSDLRLILCEASQVRRHSTDPRHEVVRSTRSLSFDNSTVSFRKASMTEAPVFFSKHSSSPSHAVDNLQKSIIQIHVTSESPTEEAIPSTSNGSVVRRNSSTKSKAVVILSEDSLEEESSTVTWDEKSVVDATVLGTAIESYLTSSSTQSTEHLPTTSHLAVPETSISSSFKGLFVK